MRILQFDAKYLVPFFTHLHPIEDGDDSCSSSNSNNSHRRTSKQETPVDINHPTFSNSKTMPPCSSSAKAEPEENEYQLRPIALTADQNQDDENGMDFSNLR